MDIKKFEKAASREQYDAALKDATERLEAVMRLPDVDPIEFVLIVLNREADSCEIQGSIYWRRKGESYRRMVIS